MLRASLSESLVHTYTHNYMYILFCRLLAVLYWIDVGAHEWEVVVLIKNV